MTANNKPKPSFSDLIRAAFQERDKRNLEIMGHFFRPDKRQRAALRKQLEEQIRQLDDEED